MNFEGSIFQRAGVALDPELSSLEARARELAASVIAPREHEDSDEAAIDFTRAMGSDGLFEACVELDVPAICLLREVVASYSGLADSMLALQGLGYGPLALAGSDAQRALWRERVTRGEAIAAIAITEPEAGSDVAAIRTEARREGEGWVLSGRKCFITNAGLAAFYTVFARTGAAGARGLSCFLVPAEKVRLVERYQLVAPHPCGEIAFDEVRLPLEALVGEEGQGFKLAMRTLDHFRATVGAAALGMAQRALDEAVARAKSRQQFGKPIGTFQQLQAMLADSWVELQASRLLVYRAAAAHRDRDPGTATHSSAAKLFATEAAQRIIDRAVQVFGGQGVRQGAVVERLYREVRALRIYEGTSEIQRLVIARALLGGG